MIENLRYSLLAVVVFVLGITSCTTLSTERFIENAEFSGIAKGHSVKITNNAKENQLTLRPRISINTLTDYDMNTGNHPKVNWQGVFEVYPVDNKPYFREKEGVNNYNFTGKNFSWESPKSVAGLEMEYGISRNIAVYVGADYADWKGKQYWGQWVGLGFRTENENLGIRADFNMDFRENYQNVKYFVKERILDHYDWFTPVYDEKYYMYEDIGNNFTNQLTFALTFNTKRISLLNGFCSLAFDKITFISYTNKDDGGLFGRDEDFEFAQNRTHLIFGLYHDIANLRMILGADLTYNNTETIKFINKSNWTKSLFIQFDIVM